VCEPSLQLSHHGGRLCRQLRRPLPVPPAGPVPSTPQPAACTFFARPASLCCLCVVLAPFPQSQSNCRAPFFPRSPVASLHSIRKQHCIHLACFLPSLPLFPCVLLLRSAALLCSLRLLAPAITNITACRPLYQGHRPLTAHLAWGTWPAWPRQVPPPLPSSSYLPIPPSGACANAIAHPTPLIGAFVRVCSRRYYTA
jgi:hypothetical protein